jgi:hypothetical protein
LVSHRTCFAFDLALPGLFVRFDESFSAPFGAIIAIPFIAIAARIAARGRKAEISKTY